MGVFSKKETGNPASFCLLVSCGVICMTTRLLNLELNGLGTGIIAYTANGHGTGSADVLAIGYDLILISRRPLDHILTRKYAVTGEMLFRNAELKR